MKILFKYPTRDRPEKFKMCLKRYYDFMKGTNFEFLISIDDDDKKMNNFEIKNFINKFKNCSYKISKNKTKIQAINQGIENTGWDILVLVSDDMIPEVIGYDDIIRQKMKNFYPDTDGVLWFYDGWRKDLNTLCILGNKYYNRFNYIYYPEYKSFWCDVEFTEVANYIKKQTFFEKIIIRHLHPDIALQDENTFLKFKNFFGSSLSYNKFGHDNLIKKNSVHDFYDKNLYFSRKKEKFNMKEKFNEEINLL